MGKLGDFFSMSKRERVGAYVVLALLVLAIATSVALRGCDTRSVSAPSVEEIDQLTDSATVERPRHKKNPKHKAKHKRKKQQEKNNQQGTQRQGKGEGQRPLQEVPQF